MICNNKLCNERVDGLGMTCNWTSSVHSQLISKTKRVENYPGRIRGGSSVRVKNRRASVGARPIAVLVSDRTWLR